MAEQVRPFTRITEQIEQITDPVEARDFLRTAQGELLGKAATFVEYVSDRFPGSVQEDGTKQKIDFIVSPAEKIYLDPVSRNWAWRRRLYTFDCDLVTEDGTLSSTPAYVIMAGSYFVALPREPEFVGKTYLEREQARTISGSGIIACSTDRLFDYIAKKKVYDLPHQHTELVVGREYRDAANLFALPPEVLEHDHVLHHANLSDGFHQQLYRLMRYVRDERLNPVR